VDGTVVDQSEVADIILTMGTDASAQRPFKPRLDSPSAERLLLDAIADGELDDHLVAIADAVWARRELLHTVRSANAIAELCVGDCVRINHRVRPRYLFGEPGVVIGLDDHAVTVRLLRPVGRFRGGELRCPPLALDKLERGSRRPAA
jgi:hypothetical protein